MLRHAVKKIFLYERASPWHSWHLITLLMASSHHWITLLHIDIRKARDPEFLWKIFGTQKSQPYIFWDQVSKLANFANMGQNLNFFESLPPRLNVSGNFYICSIKKVHGGFHFKFGILMDSRPLLGLNSKFVGFFCLP